MDKTWKEKFTNEALSFLHEHKEWQYDKIIFATSGENYLDWIIIKDNNGIEKPGEGDNKWMDHDVIRTAQIASDSELYNIFDNMFFKNINLQVGAVMNMQSENITIKEVANAIVRGDGAIIDNDMQFPFTRNVWKLPKENPNKVTWMD